MKIFVIAISLLLQLAACNSKKSGGEKETGNSDTVKALTDTAAQKINPDSTAADLGGVGELTLGLAGTTVIKLLGEPDSKSKAEEWGADGLIHQDWLYKSKGITLNMDNNKGPEEQSIFAITITSPCTFKTKKNIGIGSTYNEVITAYEKDIDKSATDKETITIGSIYGGIIIDFKKDKAEKIFVGAAAE